MKFLQSSLVCLIILFSQNLSAQNLFGEPNLISSDLQGSFFRMADLNSDGFQDVLVKNSNSIQSFLNQGDGSFEEITTTGTPSMQRLAIGNLNGDGLQDLIGVLGFEETLFFYQDEDGNFEEAFALELESFPAANLSVYDYNHDGLDDLSFSALSLNPVVMYNLGDGTFEETSLDDIEVPWGSVGAVGNMLSLDANNDGRLDLLYNYTIDSDPWIALYINQGENFVLQSSQIVPSLGVTALDALEIGDSGEVLLAVMDFTSAIQIYRINNGEVVHSKEIFLEDLGTIYYMRMVDYNHDDQPEFLFSILGDGPLVFSVLSQTGELEIVDLVDDNPSETALFDLVDFDNDDVPEIVWIGNTSGIPNSLKYSAYAGQEIAPICYLENDPCGQNIFYPSAYSHTEITEVTWAIETLGMEDYSTLENYMAPIQQPGTYEVFLTICNVFGCSDCGDSFEIDRIVEFEIPESAIVDEEINFANLSQGFTNSTWSFGTDEFSTESEVLYAYNTPGTYAVQLILTDSQVQDCTVEIDEEIVINSSSHISNSETELSVFPNPSTGVVNIESRSEISRVRIWNNQGGLINEFQINRVNSEIDISDLSSGYYILEILGEARVLRPLIVNRH